MKRDQLTEPVEGQIVPNLSENSVPTFNAFAGLSSQTQAILDKLKKTPPSTSNAFSLEREAHFSPENDRSFASLTAPSVVSSSSMNTNPVGRDLKHQCMGKINPSMLDAEDYNNRYRQIAVSSAKDSPVTPCAVPGNERVVEALAETDALSSVRVFNTFELSGTAISRAELNESQNSIRKQDHDVNRPPHASSSQVSSKESCSQEYAASRRDRDPSQTSLVLNDHSNYEVYKQNNNNDTQCFPSGEIRKQLPQQPSTQSKIISQTPYVSMQPNQQQNISTDKRIVDRDRFECHWGDLSPIQDMSPSYEDGSNLANDNAHSTSNHFGLRSSLPRAQSGTISEMLVEFDRGFGSGPASANTYRDSDQQFNRLSPGMNTETQMQPHQVDEQTTAMKTTSPTTRAHRRLPQQPMEPPAIVRKAMSVPKAQCSVTLQDTNPSTIPSSRVASAVSATTAVLNPSSVGAVACSSAVAAYSSPIIDNLVCEVQRYGTAQGSTLQPHQCPGLTHTSQVQTASTPINIKQAAQGPAALYSCPQHEHHQTRCQMASSITPALASVQTFAAQCCHHPAIATTPLTQVVQVVQPQSSRHHANDSTTVKTGQNQSQQHRTAVPHTATITAVATPQPQQQSYQSAAISSSYKVSVTPQTPGSTQVILTSSLPLPAVTKGSTAVATIRTLFVRPG